ncbi:UNVERIFIED_ORG: hypothetical protein ABIC97_001984 [Peribacillus simplex]
MKHTGAFLLLFLTEGDNYGGKLLQKCASHQTFQDGHILSKIIVRT